MKNLSLKICLAIATLLASVGSGFALPKCPSSPKFVSTYKDILNWHNCVGTVTYGSTAKYTGEFKNNMRWGAGIFSYNKKQKNSPKVQEGIFQNNQFLYAQKTPYSRKPSVLRTAFIKLSKENRRQLQTNLKDLGFYKSSIDGLYGKGTASALAKYNKQNLNGADLKKSENVEKLFNVVLELKPSPKPKPKRDLEKEFGLSLYGTFLHSEKVPNALFFFDEIEQYDSFEFRKALRSHDVDLIVLSSPGGSIFEGLNMAGIIHDKGLNTYVPNNSLEGKGDCASACSFMFFAGSTKNVEGNLGVHQFYSSDGKKKEIVEEVQENTQFTVSEIIGFLNEFETPSWVFERMFQQSEMYYFKETELVQLETEVSDELSTHYEKSEKFISDFAKAFAEVSE
ncbi:peptidoglycan-binding protein [Paracoccaceae bacterium]|nr:peptidoglycan-binding protein [Paracoccaceae bacterium]